MSPQELISFKQKALHWANQFGVCCCFDSNGYTDPYSKYDFLLAANAAQEVNRVSGHAFDALRDFYDAYPGWIFGMFGYDLKNELEDLTTDAANLLGFPDLFFFVPEYLIAVQNGEILVLKGGVEILEVINGQEPSQPGSEGKSSSANSSMHAETAAPPPLSSSSDVLNIRPRMDKDTYLAKVEELRDHIARGDIYVVNFCQEFFAEHAVINPFEVYLQLNQLSPTPFSGFFKLEDKYILSASPERYLCKRADRLISQPIKGTAKRSADPAEDELIGTTLKNDSKERAENVMIVDLVRNDLTKCAVKGSVKVDELFGIYSFPQVHQMISTVSCQLDPAQHPVNTVEHTFPMGSMTGAPKVRAMELIEEIECSRRGIYSGAFGYFNPEGDFDFNVVIRSILYNHNKGYLSFQVGGAITYASSAEAEYEECLLKASAIVKTLKGTY